MSLNPLRGLAQLIAYAAFAALVGYFAAAPAWQAADPAQAQLKLSFTHGGARLAECHRMTPEELAKIPPNMRRSLQCSRERVPVTVELEMDGQPLYRAVVPPGGLWKDGPSSVYWRFTVAPGRHRLTLRLRDDLPGRINPERAGRGSATSHWIGEWNYVRETDIVLAARDNRVIDFRADKGGFIVH
jgi:hypothetical protein